MYIDFHWRRVREVLSGEVLAEQRSERQKRAEQGKVIGKGIQGRGRESAEILKQEVILMQVKVILYIL